MDIIADSQRRTGIALVLLSTVFFSLAGVLTKSISSDVWTIVCWRGLVGGVLILGFYLWQNRGPDRVLRLGWRGWVLATVGSLASLSFIAAFKMTSVGNVAVIYAAVPFAAAALEWVLLRQMFRRATLIAASVSVLGVCIVVSGSLGAGTLAGDGMAVLMMGLCALYLVLIRVYSATPAVMALAVSSLQLFAISWFFTAPLAIGPQDAFLLFTFGASFAVASVLWTIGATRISATESGLMGAAEVPLAMLMALLFLAEVPTLNGLVGGFVVLGAVVWHIRQD